LPASERFRLGGNGSFAIDGSLFRVLLPRRPARE
jgi:hypothetical protein